MSLLITFILFILIILILFIVYNTINSIKYNNNEIDNMIKLNCLDTRFGCCNDKITPRLDQHGTNCRGF